MIERLEPQKPWYEEPPLHGESVMSQWEQADGARFLNPWLAWLRSPGTSTYDILRAEPVSIAFVQEPKSDELLRDEEFDRYRSKFGWTDEGGLDGPLFNYNGQLQRVASEIMAFCRYNTFESFKDARLGITVEFTAKRWDSEDNRNPLDHDVVPHQDWVRQDVPVAIALASVTYNENDSSSLPRQLHTNLWQGKYEYKGDLQNSDGYTIDYLDAVSDMDLVDMTPSYNGAIWVGDARRSLHGKPLMLPNEDPVVRLFMRGFVAPVDVS